jgi:DMSO/TMAO reductase YedYZ heme-binding membrane subunit
VQTEAKTKLVQYRTYLAFWGSIFTSNIGHNPIAFFRANFVHNLKNNSIGDKDTLELSEPLAGIIALSHSE